VYGAPGLPQKRPDLRFDDILSDTPQVEWRGQVEQHLFRGAPPLNEVVFFHPTTRTLILTDLVASACRHGERRTGCGRLCALYNLGIARATLALADTAE
jgi:hypothetical protein